VYAPRAGLTNLWHAESFHWHAAFIGIPSLFLLPDQCLCIVKNLCIYTNVDCVEIVSELPLLPNKTGNETLLHKSGAVRSVDLDFLTGAPAWR
jgi:hypothetical protein